MNRAPPLCPEAGHPDQRSRILVSTGNGTEISSSCQRGLSFCERSKSEIWVIYINEAPPPVSRGGTLNFYEGSPSTRQEE